MAARVGSEVKTLSQAWSEFGVKRAPRIIGAAIVLALAARIALGAFTWRDVVAVVFMLVVYPFGEWAIHVYLLHLRPFRLRGRRIDLPTAKAHREHHEDPHRLDLINFSPSEALAILLLAVPAAVGIGALLAGLLPGALPLEPLITALLAGYVLVGAYEWTHFLIHTAYRPRSRFYRSVWRNHRLHHFKNERYWHGITNTVADRVLGTHPEAGDVRRSRTARALHAD